VLGYVNSFIELSTQLNAMSADWTAAPARVLVLWGVVMVPGIMNESSDRNWWVQCSCTSRCCETCCSSEMFMTVHWINLPGEQYSRFCRNGYWLCPLWARRKLREEYRNEARRDYTKLGINLRNSRFSRHVEILITFLCVVASFCECMCILRREDGGYTFLRCAVGRGADNHLQDDTAAQHSRPQSIQNSVVARQGHSWFPVCR
jgi:hypothetical protein